MLPSASTFQVGLSRLNGQIRRTATSASNTASHRIVFKGLITNCLKYKVSKYSILASRRRLCFTVVTSVNGRLFHLTTYYPIPSDSNISNMYNCRLYRFNDHFTFFILKQIEVSHFVVWRYPLHIRTGRFAADAVAKVSARRAFLSR